MLHYRAIFPLVTVLSRIGQLQQVRLQLNHKLSLLSCCHSQYLFSSLKTLNLALIDDIRAHYKDPNNQPYPSEDPLLGKHCTIVFIFHQYFTYAKGKAMIFYEFSHTPKIVFFLQNSTAKIRFPSVEKVQNKCSSCILCNLKHANIYCLNGSGRKIPRCLAVVLFDFFSISAIWSFWFTNVNRKGPIFFHGPQYLLVVRNHWIVSYLLILDMVIINLRKFFFEIILWFFIPAWNKGNKGNNN